MRRGWAGAAVLLALAVACSTSEVPATVPDQPTTAPAAAEPTPTPAPTAAPAAAESTPAPAPTDIVWSDVASWNDWSSKETETFTTTSSEWRIVWDTEPEGCGEMNFQIQVYTAAGDLRSVAADIIGEGKGVSYVSGAGDYYLMLDTAQYYTVTVQQTQ